MEKATHIKMGDKLYEFCDNNQVVKYSSNQIEVGKLTCGWQIIHSDAFPILGIKPLKERMQEPIVFTYTVGGGIAPPNKAYGKTFLCVEILEENK